MARDYRPVDRDQQFLLPPDMRSWLPAEHLVWFIVEVIRELDLSALHAKSKRGGTGREGYDPAMLLGLWIYASARGISSSRRIERACTEDVAFRVICGQDIPDHTVLARFRQTHQEAMAGLFAQVLALCVAQGLGRFGMVAIDGTRIKANASMAKTVSLKRLRKIAAEEFAKAEATDAAEDAANTPGAGDDLPPGMGPGTDRESRIRFAIKDLEKQIEEENAPDIARQQKRVERRRGRVEEAEEASRKVHARYAQAAAEGRKLLGRPPVATEENTVVVRERAALERSQARLEGFRSKAEKQEKSGQTESGRLLAKRNTTDPESRILRTRNGYIEGYNAQLAVTDDHIIAVAELINTTDAGQLPRMMDKTVEAVRGCAEATGRTGLAVGTVTADTGYLSDEAVDAPGPDRLIAPGRGGIKDSDGWKGTIRHETKSRAASIMATKLTDPANQALYKRRSVTVEPVNGHLKDGRGLRRFARRGLPAAQAELHLAALTTNLLRIFTKPAPAAP